jgi:hypothetical protein
MHTDAKGRVKISSGRERRTRGQENNRRGKVVEAGDGEGGVTVAVEGQDLDPPILQDMRHHAPRAPPIHRSNRPFAHPADPPASAAAPAGLGPPHRIHLRDALRVSGGRRPGGRLAPCTAAQRVAVGGPAAAVTRTPGGGALCADRRGSRGDWPGSAPLRGRGVEPLVSGLQAPVRECRRKEEHP